MKKATQHGHQNRTIPRFGGELGEDGAGTQRLGRTCDGKTPQEPTGTWVQSDGGKGGRELAQERKKMQAYGAGRRDERRRLAGGGCRERLGGQRFVPGEEVGSG